MAYSVDMGNNETISCGIFEMNGSFTALLFSQSRTFKTYKGAAAWLRKMGRDENGRSL